MPKPLKGLDHLTSRQRVILSDEQKYSLFREAGILRRWYTTTMTDFDNDVTAKEKVQNYILNFDAYRSKGIGLYLYGSNGVGKTHLLMEVLKELILQRYTVRVVTLGTLVSLYTQGWYDKEANAEFNKLYKLPYILAIEEIGKEYKSGDNDLGRTVIDTIVRYRNQDMKPLLFAANHQPKDLARIYSTDISSMLKEMVITILVQGTDRRTLPNI